MQGGQTCGMASPILLPAGSNVSVKVHPVVLFSICDAYTRRKENQDRVIGTLLGVVVDNVIEVKHCYTVPHTESSEQVRPTRPAVDGDLPRRRWASASRRRCWQLSSEAASLRRTEHHAAARRRR